MTFFLAWAGISTGAAQSIGDQPLPRYLSVAQVQDGLTSADWQACVVDGADRTIQMRFSIDGEGGVSVTAVEGAPEGAETCWRETLQAVPFPAHDETPLMVRWSVGVRGGQALPYPVVDVEKRNLEPLFIFIPVDADPAAREMLLDALGVDEP